ncbi:MAG: nucleotidyltransferase family protein [Halobacteriales archaeon]
MADDPEPGGAPAPDDVPLVDPALLDGSAGEETVVGVLLAAGASSRFGEANKLLAPVDGDPVVRHAARTLVASGVDRTVAVVGHDRDRVATALDGLDLAVVDNPAHEAGLATSVRTGVRAADGADAAVFALGDVPAVRPASVDRLLAAYRAGAGDALAAACDGRRGNPVLFDARHFDRLAALSGDEGGRRVFRESDAAALVETGDEGVLLDVDTPAALERVRDLL